MEYSVRGFERLGLVLAVTFVGLVVWSQWLGPRVHAAEEARRVEQNKREQEAFRANRLVTIGIEREEVLGMPRVMVRNLADFPVHDLEVRDSCKTYFLRDVGIPSSGSGTAGQKELPAHAVQSSNPECDCDPWKGTYGSAYSKEYIESMRCLEEMEVRYVGPSERTTYSSKRCYAWQGNDYHECNDEDYAQLQLKEKEQDCQIRASQSPASTQNRESCCDANEEQRSPAR